MKAAGRINIDNEDAFLKFLDYHRELKLVKRQKSDRAVPCPNLKIYNDTSIPQAQEKPQKRGRKDSKSQRTGTPTIG